MLLESNRLIEYERVSGRFRSIELGRIVSYSYAKHNSMSVYNQHLRPAMSMIELFHDFALSNEFMLMPVRQDVSPPNNLPSSSSHVSPLELAMLSERVPIPIKESVEGLAAKINVLLQAFVSQLKLDGFALVGDMVCIQQSACQ